MQMSSMVALRCMQKHKKPATHNVNTIATTPTPNIKCNQCFPNIPCMILPTVERCRHCCSLTAAHATDADTTATEQGDVQYNVILVWLAP